MVASDVPAAELAVLEGLWADQSPTIRELARRIYPKGNTTHYATVQKLLERLENKGLVERDRSETPHRFSAAVTRDAFVAGQVRSLAEQFTQGAFLPLVTSLLRSRAITARERRELRALLEELEKKGPAPKAQAWEKTAGAR